MRDAGKMTVDPEMETAFARLAAHTLPKCGACAIPYGCCDASYCETAIAFAQDEMGVTLATTDHPRLPLMGENGCSAPPHLRPLCAVHVCENHLSGADADWIARYWSLREDASDRLEDHVLRTK